MLVVRNSQGDSSQTQQEYRTWTYQKAAFVKAESMLPVKLVHTPNIIKEVIVWQTTKKSESG